MNIRAVTEQDCLTLLEDVGDSIRPGETPRSAWRRHQRELNRKFNRPRDRQWRSDFRKDKQYASALIAAIDWIMSEYNCPSDFYGILEKKRDGAFWYLKQLGFTANRLPKYHPDQLKKQKEEMAWGLWMYSTGKAKIENGRQVSLVEGRWLTDDEIIEIAKSRGHKLPVRVGFFYWE